MLPKEPSLILMDELLNYVIKARKTGLSSELYNFLQSLSEETRAQDRVVLCVSIPGSELEMNPEDQRDYELNWDRNRYRFGLRPNLNQILVTRRGAVSPKAIEARVGKTTEDLFREGPKFLDRRFFPERSNDIPDRP